MSAICCAECGEPVDVHGPNVGREVVGIEVKGLGASRRGGSDVTLRRPTGRVFHTRCVERMKRGVSARQEAMEL